MKKYFVFKNYKNFFSYHLKKKYKTSYAQCGEDIIIDAFLRGLSITQPTYIDIGTYHPILNNNTYLFYKNGGHGICIEPDEDFFRLIQKNRPKDISLNVGVGPEAIEKANFYLMSSHNLNTFSKSEAELTVTEENYGKQEIKKVVQLPLVTAHSLIEKYLHTAPDILSVDAEGLDFEIITSIDLTRYRPKIICTETLRYGPGQKLGKETSVSEYLAKNDYILYADTYVNSLFVDKKYLHQ